MQREGDEVHFETDEARGASTPNIVRWVLAISLFAAIALLSVVWITGAVTQGEPSSGDARKRVLSEYGSTGGILPGTSGDGDTAPPGENTAPVAPAPAAAPQPTAT